MRSLRNARTFEELCELRRDHFSTKHYWISADETTVSIYAQTSGEEPRESVTVPRRQFNALIDFYQREQLPRKRAR